MKNIKESMIILMALAGFYTLSFLGFSSMNNHGNGFNLEKYASQQHLLPAMDIEVISITSVPKDCAEDEENLFMCEDATAYEVEDDSIFENFNAR